MRFTIKVPSRIGRIRSTLAPSILMLANRGPLFKAYLVVGKGGVTAATSTGIWATDFTGTPRLLFRNGVPNAIIPGKTLSYARYDVVRVLNSLMEALRLDESSIERLMAKVMSFPARRFLRSRRDNFVVIVREHGQHFRPVNGIHVSAGCADGYLPLARGAVMAKLFYNFRAERLHRTPASRPLY